MTLASAAVLPALLVRAAELRPLSAEMFDQWSPAERAVFAALGGLYSLALGLVVGSFLNVVAYRWPAGLSLLWPPSRCDQCGTRLAARDNVPVVSWLWLGGRCRGCGVPLSVRYPLVELATGLAFVGLYLGVIVRAGSAWSGAASVELPAGITLGRLGALAGFAAGLVSWLLVVALLEADRQPLPIKLWVVGLAGAMLPPLAAPQLQPLNWDGGNWSDLPARLPIDPALTSVCGGLLGLVAGPLLAPRDAGWLTAALATTGLAFGWQGMLVVASCVALCLAGQLVWRRFVKRPPAPAGRFPRSGWAVPALIVTLASGEPLVALTRRAGLAGEPWPVMTAVVVIVLVGGAVRWLDRG